MEPMRKAVGIFPTTLADTICCTSEWLQIYLCIKHRSNYSKTFSQLFICCYTYQKFHINGNKSQINTYYKNFQFNSHKNSISALLNFTEQYITPILEINNQTQLCIIVLLWIFWPGTFYCSLRLTNVWYIDDLYVSK